MNQLRDQNSQDRQEARDRWVTVVRYLAILALPIVFVWLTVVLFGSFPSARQSTTWYLALFQILFVGGLFLLLANVVFAAMFFLFRPDVLQFVRQRKKEADVMSQVTPDLVRAWRPAEIPKPKPQPARSRWRSCLSFLLLFVVLVAVFAGIDQLMARYWPTAPRALKDMLPFILIIMAVVAREGLKKILETHEATRPFPWKKLAWGVTGIVLILILMVGFILVLDWIGHLFGNSLLSVIAVLLTGFGLAMSMLIPGIILPEAWINGPLRQLDYGKALARAKWLDRLFRSKTLESIVLLHAGRCKTAESAVRRSIANVRKSWLLLDIDQGWLLEILAYALTEQARYDEAITAFEGAIELGPQASDRPNGLAEVYLRQGIEPHKALALVEHSLKNKKRRFVEQYFVRYATGEVLGNRAWALALAGQSQESQATLAQALKQFDKHSKLSEASVHYRAGHAMRLCGDETAAREHFARALDLDPHGNYGQLARRACA